MSDVLFLLLTVAFFAVAVGFVRICDRIVGRGDDVPPGSSPTERAGTTPVPATASGTAS